MTKKQIFVIVAKYEYELNGYPPERWIGDAPIISARLASRELALRHAMWMCKNIPELVKKHKMKKANQWLGFIQGILWVTGTKSINIIIHDSKIV